MAERCSRDLTWDAAIHKLAPSSPMCRRAQGHHEVSAVMTTSSPERQRSDTHARRQSRKSTIVALLLSSAATGTALLGGSRMAAGSYFAALVVAYGAFAVVLTGLRRAEAPLRWPILVAGTVLLVLALVRPPIESNDLWSYASYGRMVTVHHESPWKHEPADHPRDPYTRRVTHLWRDTPSVYGPAFAVPAVAVMAVAGTHVTVARLGFQMLAGLAVVLALCMVGRQTGWNAEAIAVLAVNPLVPISIVNAGHNDAWVGVLLLGAVLLTKRERWVWAGVVVATAAMVKVTALLALVALAVWAFRQAGRRAAAKLIGAGVLASLVMVLAAGGSDVLRAMRWNSWRMTNGNLWARTSAWMFHEFGPEPHRLLQGRLALVAACMTVGIAGYLVTRHRRASHPALLVGLTVLAYTLVSAYVLPWYVAWGLIPLALCPRAPTTRLLVGVGALFELATVTRIEFMSHQSSLWSPALLGASLMEHGLPWMLAALAGGVVVVGSIRWRGVARPSGEAMSSRW